MNPATRANPAYPSVSTRRRGAPPAGQRGAATLVVVLILLFAMTLIVLAMGRVGLVEQTISGNEQRALKAINAAEAGLEYGMTWLAENFVDASVASSWPNNAPYTGTPLPTDSTFWTSTSNAGILWVPNNVTPGSGEQYDVRVVIDDAGTSGTTPETPYIRVASYARDTNDNSVTAAVQQYAAKTSAGTAESGGAPPLAMNGCFDSTPGGTPKVYPCTTAGTAFPNESIRTGPWAMTLAECVSDESLHESLRGTKADPQGLCRTTTPPDPADCPDLAGGSQEAPLALHDGDVNPTLSGTDAAWNAVFPNLTKEEFKNLAEYEKELMAAGAMTVAERNFIYFDSGDPRSDDPADWGFNNDDWTKDLGTGNTDDIGTIDESGSPCGTIEPRLAKHPVVLYFGNGGSTSSACPTLNGTVIIWGVVYYENCDDDGPGWGAGTVFGTVAVEGNLDMLTADGTLCCIENSTGGVASDDRIYSTLVRVPGTWSDL